MKFLYYLCNAGWAGLIFEDEKTSLNYSISYCMGDSLTELLRGLIVFVKYKAETGIIEQLPSRYSCEDDIFEWIIDQEGSSVKFIMSKIKNTENINLKIIENHDEPKCIYDGNINLNELIDNILFSCAEMIQKYGIIGYSLNFWTEFPMTYYLMLKDYRLRKINYDSFTEINCDGKQTLERTNISTEIDYIIKMEQV